MLHENEKGKSGLVAEFSFTYLCLILVGEIGRGMQHSDSGLHCWGGPLLPPFLWKKKKKKKRREKMQNTSSTWKPGPPPPVDQAA